MSCTCDKKSKKGFTLAEVLLVVAIIAILLAIAVPNIIAYYRQLKLTQLDDSARTIFLAAQNELTAIMNSGEDPATVVSGGETKPKAADGTVLGTYRYVGKTDATIGKLVIAGSIESSLYENNYVVEYDPTTGAVYAAWYWEGDKFTYNPNYSEEDTVKSVRLENGVRAGYYGGTSINRVEVGQMPIPIVTLTNAEELRLEVAVPAGDSIMNGRIYVDVSINGTSIAKGTTWVDHKSTVILDTLKPDGTYKDKPDEDAQDFTVGKRFKDWVDPKVVHPGEALEVVVSLVDKYGRLLPQSIVVQTNGLFAGLEGSYTALIAYGRHLQNLDSESEVSDLISSAKQIRTIDFKATHDDKDYADGSNDKIYYWKETYDDKELKAISSGYLSSYDGQEYQVRNMTARGIMYSGMFSMLASTDSSVEISNITLVNPAVYLDEHDKYAFSAGAVAGAVFTSININNCKVYNDIDLSDYDYTGTHDNVPGIWAKESTLISVTDVGGLVGIIYGDVTVNNSFASMIACGDQFIGGLIGSCGNDVTISNSYAACLLEGGVAVGGLVGNCDNIDIPDIKNEVNISNSYAAGEILSGASESVAGLIGRIKNPPTITNSYAAVRYVGFSDTDTVYGTYPGDTSTIFVKQNGIKYEHETAAVSSSQLASKVKDFGPGWYSAPSGTNPLGFTFPYKLVEQTRELKDPYPYPMLGSDHPVDHYGDWLWEDGTSLVYWEQYDITGKDYGVWGMRIDSKGELKEVDTLLKGDINNGTLEYAVADGYGLLVRADATPPDKVKIGEDEYEVKKPGVEVCTYDGVTYSLYEIDTGIYDGITTDYYREVELGGKTYYFNPHFACDVYVKPETGEFDKTKPAKKGTDNNTDVYIRTPRQLAKMVEYTTNAATPDAKGWRYEQTLDVNYEKYDYNDFKTGKDGNNRQMPGELDRGAYNGNDFLIRNIYLKENTNSNVGIFDKVFDSTLEHIKIQNVNAFVAGDSGDAILGALAAQVKNSTVDDCGVYAENKEFEKYAYDAKYYYGVGGADPDNVVFEKRPYYRVYAISTNRPSIIGGLFGQIDHSNVSRSFAAIKLYGQTSVGGFAGIISDCTIKDCYSAGSTIDGTYYNYSECQGTDTMSVGTGAGTAGGFAGTLSGDVTFKGINYSTCSVRGDKTEGGLGKVGLFVGTGSNFVKREADAIIYSTGVVVDTSTGKRGETTKGQDDRYNYFDLAATNTYNNEKDYLLTGTAIPRKAKEAGFSTYEYDKVLKDAEYPFATNLKEHYGDWVEPLMLAYIEEYEGGGYGVYTARVNKDGNPEAVINTLRTGNGEFVVKDMYRFLSTSSKNPDPKLTKDGENTITIDGSTYYLYTIPELTEEEQGKLKEETLPKYYMTKDVGTGKYVFNPFFACEAFDVTEVGYGDIGKKLNKPGAGGPEDTAEHEGVVIRTARQLASLQKYMFNSGDVSYSWKWDYEQLLDIDFNKYNGDINGKTADNRFAALRLLDGSYDGHNHIIRNLYIQDGGGYSGLFRYVGDGTTDKKALLKNIRLVNIQVEGTGMAGGLVGALVNEATVKNCGIYVDEENIPKGVTKSAYEEFHVTGNSSVGGLIGRIGDKIKDKHTSAYVESSFAAVQVIGKDHVGGLAGYAAESSTIKDSYSGGHTDSGKYTAVGANVKMIEGGTESPAGVGGFIGTVESGVTISGTCYSTASVSATAATQNPGLFVGYVVSGNFKVDTGANLYAIGEAFVNGLPSVARDESEYLVNPKIVTETVDAEPYYTTLGTTYPYQNTKVEHHGDWPALLAGVYYETVDGTTYYYGDDIKNLKNGGTAIDDGYGFLSTVDLGEKLIATVNGKSTDLPRESVSVTNGDKTYNWCYKIPATELKVIPDGHYYQLITVNGQYFTANLSFASEIFRLNLKTEVEGGSFDNVLAKEKINGTLIRTARQLANAGAWTNSEKTTLAGLARNLDFVQELDVNFTTYTGTAKPVVDGNYNHTPIILESGGSYDGNRHLVENMKPTAVTIDNECLSGMLGRVNGKLKGIRIVNANVSAPEKSAGSLSYGTLAGYVASGSVVTDCGAYVRPGSDYNEYMVKHETNGTITNGDHVGGLIGTVGDGANVSDSFAAVKVTGTNNVGGFAGTIGGTIKNCYAGGHTEGGKYSDDDANVTAKEVTGSANGNAGGFAGNVGNTLKMEGVVYSTASVSGQHMGAFVGTETDKEKMKAAKGGDTIVYATGTAVKKSNDNDLWDEATEYGLLTRTQIPGGTLDVDKTHNYDSTLDGQNYPYISNLEFHYGDWVTYEAEGLFYWEQEDGKYHVYALVYDGGGEPYVKSDLCTDHDCKNKIDNCGYGVFGGLSPSVTKECTEAGIIDALQKQVSSAKNIRLIDASTPIGTAKTDDGKILAYNLNYAAALAAVENADKLGTSEHPYQIRTQDQLEHIASDTDAVFVQTHDISGNGNKYTPAEIEGSGSYNGQSYRILDLTIGNGSGDAALFSEVSGTVENMILYSPEGTGKISGTNAAGIAAELKDGTIENCAVAGYTVTGKNNVGGLAAVVTGSSKISDSEATVDRVLDSTSGGAMGGLVGNIESGGSLNVTSSYAGGTSSNKEEPGSMTYVGGIAAQGSNVTYNNVYSYVDMTEVKYADKKVTFYGVGPGAKEDSGANFWDGGVPDPNTEDQDLGMSLSELENLRGEMEAKEVYIPDSEGKGLTNKSEAKPFPYCEYVKDENKVPVHYGDWPEAEKYAGILYWEKEKVDGVEQPLRLYVYGAMLDSNGKLYESRLLDTLCYDHHVSERASIVESGYGYFEPTDGSLTVGYPNTGKYQFNDDNEGVGKRLCEELNLKAENYTVKLLTSKHTKLTEVKDNWDISADGKEKITLKVYPCFAAAIYDKDFDMGGGSDADVEEAEPMQIRTVEQFKNIDANKGNNDIDYIVMSHDIDFKDTGNYTPGQIGATVFDGQGYRILDVAISVTGDAGLFISNMGGETKFKNIIMYSPGGKTIESTGSGDVGGIVAKSSNNSSSKYTFDKCVVAGYTMKGYNSIGGLAGSITNSGNSISNCQAVVTIERQNGQIRIQTYAGGLVGRFRGTITESYTGGKIEIPFLSSAIPQIGGIVGNGGSGIFGNNTTINNCYTYIDLISSGYHLSISTLGNQVTESGDNYYYDAYRGIATPQGTGLSLEEMKTRLGDPKADYTYTNEPNLIPETPGFPFRAVVTVEGKYVHYGVYPE